MSTNVLLCLALMLIAAIVLVLIGFGIAGLVSPRTREARDDAAGEHSDFDGLPGQCDRASRPAASLHVAGGNPCPRQ
jgi:hypothetical protein